MVSYKEITTALIRLAKENDLKKPYGVGGIVRDRLLRGNKEVNDLDVTNGTVEVLELGHLLHEEFPKTLLKVHKNNHVTVYFANLQIDFSNNWRNPFVKKELEAMGKDASDDLLVETYSRDFTVNSLLLDLETSEIVDITGHGLEDLNNRVIKTAINPDYILRFNPIRMLRALKLSVELGFAIDPSLKEASSKNAHLLSNVSKEQIKKILTSLFETNPPMAMRKVEELGLYKVLYTMGVLDDFMIEKINE